MNAFRCFNAQLTKPWNYILSLSGLLQIFRFTIERNFSRRCFYTTSEAFSKELMSAP